MRDIADEADPLVDIDPPADELAPGSAQSPG